MLPWKYVIKVQGNSNNGAWEKVKIAQGTMNIYFNIYLYISFVAGNEKVFDSQRKFRTQLSVEVYKAVNSSQFPPSSFYLVASTTQRHGIALFF